METHRIASRRVASTRLPSPLDRAQRTARIGNIRGESSAATSRARPRENPGHVPYILDTYAARSDLASRGVRRS